MNKTGMVLNIKKNKVYMVTNAGEFVYVTANSKMPVIGDIYSGKEDAGRNYIHIFTTVAAIFIILFLSVNIYSYFTPCAVIKVSINPSLELQTNKYNRIISSKALNNDGKTILSEIELKNKNINDALIAIVKQAKKDNFINQNYNSDGKIILINIESAKDKHLKLDSFESYINKNNINYNIDNNGNAAKKIFKDNSNPTRNENINKSSESSDSTKDINKENQPKNNTTNNIDNRNNNSNKVNNNSDNSSSNSGNSSKKDNEKDIPKETPEKNKKAK